MKKITDLGKIGITLAGEYNDKTIYEKLTIVLYKGKSYISTKTIQGISPEEDICSWQLIAEAKDAYHMLVDAGKTTLTEEEFLKQLEDATKGRYIVQGNIINAADEEDLTIEHSNLLGIDTLKLANRDNTNGMGYIILRKNKSFSEQVIKANTIYEIRYKFNLDNEEVTIPEGCVLKFEGGSINNGTIKFSNTQLINAIINCNVTGRILNTCVNVRWFGAFGDGNHDEKLSFENAIKVASASGLPVYVPNGTYKLKGLDIEYDDITIYGESINGAILYNDEWGLWTFRSSKNNICIHDLSCISIPHTQATKNDDIHYTKEERDNAHSFILYKGEGGRFYNIYAEEIQTCVLLGGDYLDMGILLDNNQVYNISLKNVQWGVLAMNQKNCIIHDINGNFGTFSANDYESGVNAGHIVYFSGATTSRNIMLYNINANKGLGGSTLSLKNIDGLSVKNVFSINSSLLITDNVTNGNINDVYCINNTSGLHAIQITATAITERIDSNVDLYINNVHLNGYKATIRIADNASAKISNCIINSTTSDVNVAYWVNVYESSYVCFDGLSINCPLNGYLYALGGFSAKDAIYRLDINGDKNYVIKQTECTISTFRRILKKEIAPNSYIINDNYVCHLSADFVSETRNIFYFHNINFTKNIIQISNNVQSLISFQYVGISQLQELQIIVENIGNSNIHSRLVDIQSGYKFVFINGSDDMSLNSENAIVYNIIIIGKNVIVNTITTSN